MDQADNTTVAPQASQSSNNMMPIIIVIILLVLGIGAYTMYSQQQKTRTTEVTINQQMPADDNTMMMEGDTTDAIIPSGTDGAMMDQESATGESMMMGEVKTINVEGGAFYYKPNEIRVKKGEKVKIVMKSVDMMHDFVIDELGVKSPIIKSGETGTVEFTADKAGTYEYYCSVGQHRAQGQVGKLIVE